MKKNLEFETPQVENSFGTGIFIRNLDIIKLCIYFHLIINVFKFYFECSDIHWFISLFRIVTAFFVFSICMAILNLNKFESNYYIRLFLQIDTVINILIKTKIFYGVSLGDNLLKADVTDALLNNTNLDINNTFVYNSFNETSVINNTNLTNAFGELANITSNLLFQNSFTDNDTLQANNQSNLHKI